MQVPATEPSTGLHVGDVRVVSEPLGRACSDQELLEGLRAMCRERLLIEPLISAVDSLLVEMIARRDGRFEPVVEEAWRGSVVKPVYGSDEDPEAGDLQLLTALRRLQGKPDPVAIEVREVRPETVVWPGGVELDLAIVHRDLEGELVTLRLGGDYRSGRATRWRLEAVGADGRPAERCRFRPGIGGGAEQVMALAPGAEQRVTLRSLSYLEPLEPGRYRLRAARHEYVSIVDEPDLEGRLCLETADIAVEVRPRTIRATKVELAMLAQAFEEHDENEPLWIVAPWEAGNPFDVANPRTPIERIASGGWKSVPVLIDALDRPSSSVRERAWALVLLYDLTGVYDPTAWDAGVGLVRERYGRHDWGSGHVLLGGSGTVGSGEPSRTAQEPLIAKWRAARRFLDVRVE
jgi:hypothetical protein